MQVIPLASASSVIFCVSFFLAGAAEPVGTFYIAVAGPGGSSCSRFAFPTDRAGVQLRSAGWALDLLRRRVLGA